MEDRAKRLKRFEDGPRAEIIETLLNSIVNFYNRAEIEKAADAELWLLVILGIHAVSLTISEGLFGKTGLEGFSVFLENFVDAREGGFDFSAVASEIHNWRNVIAHRWLSDSGYEFGFDTNMTKGWERRGNVVFINPKLYYLAYKNAFRGRIWHYGYILSEDELQQAKERLLDQYKK